MIDIETMGNKAGAALVSIAAVQFDLHTGQTGEQFYVNVDLQSCLNAGLKVDASTLIWWMQQNENARMKFTYNPSPLHAVLAQLSEFVASVGLDCEVWGNSARFDLGILEVAFTACKMQTPWKFWNERDVRTLVAFAPDIKANEVFIGDKHDPIHDCLHQIKYCTKIYNLLAPVKTHV
jgi:hypothetical protein